MANTTYYIDPYLINPATGLSVAGAGATNIIYSGNDAFGQPFVSGPLYATLNEAYTASAGNNNKFYMRRGRYHDAVAGVFIPVGFNRTDNIFSDYGPASDFMPVLDCGYWITDNPTDNALWTYNSVNGAWTRLGSTFGTAINTQTDARLFFGSTKVDSPYPITVGVSTPSGVTRVLGTPYHRATTLADIGGGNTANAGLWFLTNSGSFDLSIWTGSPTINPAQKWGPIYLVASRSNVNFCMNFRNGADRNKVRNLDVWGVFSAAVSATSMTTAGVNDLEITNVKSTASGTSAFSFVGDSAAGYAITKVRLNNVVVDSKSQPSETSIPNINNADWINIGVNVNNFVVNGFTIYTGECHTALNTSDPGAAVAPSRDITFINGNVYFLPGTTDGRGIGINDLANINFKNVWIYNAPSGSEISGTNVRFVSCGFIGTQENPNDPSSIYWPLRVLATGKTGANLSNIVFDGCVFDLTNSASYTAGCISTAQATAGSTPIPTNAVTIQNCVGICKAGQGFYGQVNTGAYAGANNNLVIRNNYMLRPDGLGTHKSGTTTGPFTDQGYNSFRGASGNLATTQELALMTSEYRLKPSSPLIATGIFSRYQTDKAGNQYRNPPSIGAYEYMTPPTART